MLFPVHAKDSNETNHDSKKSRIYEFSIGPQFGFIHGQSIELVYPTSTKGEFLSELIWDMKPIFYCGIKADFGKIDVMSSPGFFASASFKAGIPSDSGKMEDRDWMSIENSALTHFSSHDNKTKELFMADLLLGASIPIKSLLYIKPFISGSWMHFSFSGRDGNGTYARKVNPNADNYTFYHPIEDNPATWSYSGEVITYRQDWLLAAAGFSIGTEILHPFLLELSFKISPLTYCIADDHHIGKKTLYKDFTSFGLYIEPEINISFFIKQFELSLNCAYKYIGNTKGNSYSKSSGSSQYYLSGKAGAGLSVFDTRLLFSVRF